MDQNLEKLMLAFIDVEHIEGVSEYCYYHGKRIFSSKYQKEGEECHYMIGYLDGPIFSVDNWKRVNNANGNRWVS